MKKIFVAVLPPLFGVVVSLLVIEVGFRIVSASPPKRWDDRPKEYFIHEQAKTLQDYPYSPDKPVGTYRIAAIGDSFTFAPYMQFDDTYPKRLERWLNLNASQPRVEVVNYGVPAYSTSHEVPVVRRALKEGADLLLLQITLNDPEIKPYTPTQLFRETNEFGDLELAHPIFGLWRSLGWAMTRIHNTKTHRNYVDKFFRLFDGKKTWDNFSGSWRRIAKLSAESNVPVIAVVFPLYGIPLDERYPFHPIHKKISELLTELKVPHLDLFPVFEGIPLERLQVIVGADFHPNEIGHRLAAEEMLRWIEANRFVPESILPEGRSPKRIGIVRPGLEREAPEGPNPFDAPNVTDEGEALPAKE